jgi:2-amino-4-hydroxy-6-hydroxymethyldihydropteridine diphosphokinase
VLRSSAPQTTLPELAFIALGSNIDPEENLPRAMGCLAEIGALRAASMVYQNAAVGPVPAPDFLNAAALAETGCGVAEIRRHLRRIEKELGRVRTADRYAPRPIDLDLCLLGSLVLSTPEFTMPDPDLLTRPHLAVTLAELYPDFPHPVTGETLQLIASRLRLGADLRARPDVALHFPSITT